VERKNEGISSSTAMDGVDSQPVADFAAGVGAPSRTFSPTDPLAGIIGYLSEKGVVNVLRAGRRSHFGVKNIVPPKTKTVFGTGDKFPDEDIAQAPNHWVCYDFREMRVLPTHYTLRSAERGLVGTSLDGTEWAEIDRRAETQDLFAGRAFKMYRARGPTR
jgi:hypothetical protein